MVIDIKLNKNHLNKYGEYPVVVSVSHNTKTAFIPTGISVEEKNFVGGAKGVYIKRIPNTDEINSQLHSMLIDFQNKACGLKPYELDKMTVTDIKKFLLSEQTTLSERPTFIEYARSIENKYKGSTQKLVHRTIEVLCEYWNGRPVFFDDITTGMLRDIDDELAKKGNSLNTRAIYFRHFRAIINRAIDDGITVNYPFRAFKIKSAAKKKQQMTAESLRKIANMQFDATENLRELARDVFMLSFYLCGVNLKDIYNWKKNKLKNGKICFVRYKIRRFEPETVEITLQPEAQALLDKYCGKEYLFSFAEQYPNYDTFIGNIDKRVRTLREAAGFNELTMYYARYTWATIAYEIGIDEKIISRSLGHQETTVAGKFYILYNWKKTDEANRRVIDYVFK